MRPTGCFCQGGWRLQVQGSVAQLVINDASHTQAGSYKWYLQGLQRNIRVTTLNVSGAESQDLKVRGHPLFTHPYSPETPCPSKAGDQFRVAPVVISIIASLVFLVVIGRDGSELEDGGPVRRVINRPETQNRLQESCPTLRPPAPALTPQEWSPVCPTSIWLTDAQEPRSGGRQKQLLSLPAGTGDLLSPSAQGASSLPTPGRGAGRGRGRDSGWQLLLLGLPPHPTPGQWLAPPHLSLPQVSQLPDSPSADSVVKNGKISGVPGWLSR
ncbi:secreted and transmembrane protein 1 isoform X3 [Mirounga leonina]|nr:secreted and transmembrane protein 1 isoform X3 [Mirounga leonina]